MKANAENESKAKSFRYAGYAVACYDQKLSIPDISLLDHGTTTPILQVIHNLPQLDTAEESARTLMEKMVIALFCALEAEKKMKKQKDLDFNQTEHKKIRKFITPFTRSDRELLAYVNLLSVRAQDFISDALIWQHIKDLAKEIINRKEVSGRAARQIIRDSFSRSFEKWKKRQQSGRKLMG